MKKILFFFLLVCSFSSSGIEYTINNMSTNTLKLGMYGAIGSFPQTRYIYIPTNTVLKTEVVNPTATTLSVTTPNGGVNMLTYTAVDALESNGKITFEIWSLQSPAYALGWTIKQEPVDLYWFYWGFGLGCAWFGFGLIFRIVRNALNATVSA